MTQDLGIDWSCTQDIDPFARTVTGLATVREACVRRLSSRLGSLLGDPLYGTDLVELLSQGGEAKTMAVGVTSRIRAQLARDERVLFVGVTRADYSLPTKRLDVAMTVTTAEGPFSLVFALSPEGIQIISEGV